MSAPPDPPPSRLRALKAVAIRGVRATVGYSRFVELTRIVPGIPSTVRNRRFQQGEIERIGAGRVTAEVVTVIPTYKRPDLLPIAVRSALAQDVPGHAVVVVSDGEPVTGDLPDDERLHVFRLSRNCGIAGVVRNVGIGISASPVIAFLDDDNEWMPGHLATIVSAVREGADVAYTGLVRVLPDGREFDRISQPYVRRTLRNGNYIDMNTVAVRRTPKVRFSTRWRPPLIGPGEDWEFVWRVCRGASVRHIDRIDVRYLINPASYYWPGHTEWAEEELRQRGDGSEPTTAGGAAGRSVADVQESLGDR